ncbi:hypothetical protein [Haliangium sp. UPWRP_2]|uniref:hypothetical protein n=1 Tax=Haliangium sp. UPWRP_2 TaxID=1931276 RepID=UPI000D0CBD71|nr:hypothetical protein [Haliangium sp. UPWRP_2]PSM31795.1 hypothetical protein BVG81_003600 [Haliangium sp. UPWRP_2]
MTKEKTEQNIEAVADAIDDISAERFFDSLTDEEVASQSVLVRRLLNHSNADPGWIQFSHLLGRLELTMTAAHSDLQESTDLALQMLMVLTGAQDKMQLLEFGERLRSLESKVPSILREMMSGYLGGQAAQSSASSYYLLPGSNPTAATPVTQAPNYTQYPWNALAKSGGRRQPVRNAAVTLASGGAMLSSVGEPSIGIAVDVDTVGQTVRVAFNGQKIDSLPDAFMTGLSIGDELIAVVAPIGGRYLVTMTEAAGAGYTPGQPVRVVARVLQASSGERSIVVVDQPTQPMPII